MADRFYSEGSRDERRNANPESPQRGSSESNAYYRRQGKSLGDFSENISSSNGRMGEVSPNSALPKQDKKFEVHIDNFDSFMNTSSPNRRPPQGSRPAARPSATGRPAAPNQGVRRPGAAPGTGTARPSGAPRPSGASRPTGAARPTGTARPTSAPGQRGAVPPSQPASGRPRPAAAQKKQFAGKSAPSKKGSRQSLSDRIDSFAKKMAVKGMKKQSAAPSSGEKPTKTYIPEAQRERIRARRRYNFIKSALVASVCIFFVAILTVTASTVAMSTLNDILVIDRGGNYSVTVEIPEGSDYEQVFDILADNGLIKQRLLCDLFCRYRHYDKVKVKNSETGEYETKKIEYQPGVYYLDANTGVEVMLETIMIRKNVSKDTVRLTFPEGWTIAQIFEKIEKYKVCDADKLYANLDIISKQYDFINKVTRLSGRYLIAEGYLFPDTYDFYLDESPSSVLKKLFNNFQAKWTEDYQKRADELGLSVDDVINIAAMIQREAKDTTQMSVISGVIHNRLNDPSTYPLLQMNSTKDYITSMKDYNLFTEFYFDLYLSTYNTYSAEGLPPGPICNPGAAAIKAALYPADTDYYFFCHSSTGEIYLARTAQEHAQNTQKVLYGDNG
ncbi:MAG: endolytic transglycosylase MltG [Oscillospiraceae bacterium]|nr:endolytic transglycosylase MltG [Oscillospiraceae bacterium]